MISYWQLKKRVIWTNLHLKNINVHFHPRWNNMDWNYSLDWNKNKNLIKYMNQWFLRHQILGNKGSNPWETRNKGDETKGMNPKIAPAYRLRAYTGYQRRGSLCGAHWSYWGKNTEIIPGTSKGLKLMEESSR